MTINIRLVKRSTKPTTMNIFVTRVASKTDDNGYSTWSLEKFNIYRLAEWSTKPMTMDTARGVLRETARHLAGFLDSHKKVRQNCGEF